MSDMDDTHGMGGESSTHCCYKHEYKEFISPESTDRLRAIFDEALTGTFNNSFEDNDRCDAIQEILLERGEPDIFREYGLAEDQTRLFTGNDDLLDF